MSKSRIDPVNAKSFEAGQAQTLEDSILLFLLDEKVVLIEGNG